MRYLVWVPSGIILAIEHECLAALFDILVQDRANTENGKIEILLQLRREKYSWTHEFTCIWTVYFEKYCLRLTWLCAIDVSIACTMWVSMRSCQNRYQLVVDVAVSVTRNVKFLYSSKRPQMRNSASSYKCRYDCEVMSVAPFLLKEWKCTTERDFSEWFTSVYKNALHHNA